MEITHDGMRLETGRKRKPVTFLDIGGEPLWVIVKLVYFHQPVE